MHLLRIADVQGKLREKPTLCVDASLRKEKCVLGEHFFRHTALVRTVTERTAERKWIDNVVNEEGREKFYEN